MDLLTVWAVLSNVVDVPRRIYHLTRGKPTGLRVAGLRRPQFPRGKSCERVPHLIPLSPFRG